MIFELPDWAGYLRFSDQFEAVMDPRRYTIDWLNMKVATNQFRPFVGKHACIVAEIITYEATQAREVHGVVAAGDLQEIEELIPLAEEWGRSLGCIAAQIDSRDGWERVMKKHGYERLKSVIRKEL